MKKIFLLLVFTLTSLFLAALGADSYARWAELEDSDGATWKIADVFVNSEPGPFYESRFCLAVSTNIFHIAIPPESLISFEVDGENCIAEYQWMGERHSISGKVTSRQIGGKNSLGNLVWPIHNVKKLTFNEPPPGLKQEGTLSYDTTLVLTDGTKVPAAKLLRVSSQPFSAVPASGIDAGTVFDLYNDVGFFRGESAPSIKFKDIKSMEFPSENTIVLKIRQAVNTRPDKGKSDRDDRGKSADDFLSRALNELEGEKNEGSGVLPKNWTYGFTGTFDKGYFFIHNRHVKAIEFGIEGK